MKRWNCMVIVLVIMTIGVPYLWAGQGTYETNEWIRHTDIENSSDMTGISRFQGAIIQYYNVANWDKYILPVSKLEVNGGQKTWAKKLVLEGKITRIQYSVNRKNNPAFINHNYEAALKGAGWKILFKGCDNDELGNDSYEWCFYYYGSDGLNNDKWGSAFGPRGRSHCYLTARLDDPLHTYYAAIYTVDYENSAKGLALTLITQDVIEVKKAQTGLVTAGKMSAASPSRSMSDVPSFDIKQEAVLNVNDLSSQTSQTHVSAPTAAKPGEENAPPKLIPMPSVVGKFKLKAKKILTKQGFKVSIRGHKVGVVTGQSPKANSRVAPGSSVTITIGK